MRIRPVENGDAEEWERMRTALWPSSQGDHASEIAEFFGGRRDDPAETLIALDEAGRALGFAEVSIRPYAEGCRTRRVAYLEGWWVEPDQRRRGIGAALVKSVEAWGRTQGCVEMASDTEVENTGSAAAHRALGFAETIRITCFRKTL